MPQKATHRDPPRPSLQEHWITLNTHRWLMENSLILHSVVFFQWYNQILAEEGEIGLEEGIEIGCKQERQKARVHFK